VIINHKVLLVREEQRTYKIKETLDLLLVQQIIKLIHQNQSDNLLQERLRIVIQCFLLLEEQ
jgi:hypothetical protein